METKTTQSRTTKKCLSLGCGKCAQGSTDYCIAHGGGRRCTFPGCSKGARDKNFCAGHGGGKRCAKPECGKAAVGGSTFCTSHGGGKKCAEEGCLKSAQSPTLFCVRHGGGKTCAIGSCKKVARGKSKFCASHGGGQPCRVDGCPTAAVSNNLYCRKHRAILRCDDSSSSRTELSVPYCAVIQSNSSLTPNHAPFSLTNSSPSSAVSYEPDFCLPPPPVITVEGSKPVDSRVNATGDVSLPRPLLFQAEEIDAAMILQSLCSQGNKMFAAASTASLERSRLHSMADDRRWTHGNEQAVPLKKRKGVAISIDEMNEDYTTLKVPKSPSTTEEGSSSETDQHSYYPNPVSKKVRPDISA